jgi:hypothetical protein
MWNISNHATTAAVVTATAEDILIAKASAVVPTAEALSDAVPVSTRHAAAMPAAAKPVAADTCGRNSCNSIVYSSSASASVPTAAVYETTVITSTVLTAIV